MRALVIDDDPRFRKMLSLCLEQGKVDYTLAESGEEGLRILEENTAGSFDLILLDVEMPGQSGWDLLLSLRESGNEIPVIFVTGHGEVQERVKGLRMGADDYVTKPFEFEELIARLESVVRRRRAMPIVAFGDVSLDLARRRVERAGKNVDLSPREYDLLQALIQAEGELLSRGQLLREVWDMDFDPGTNVIEVHIGRLRRKLDRHGRPLIETVRGEGYRAVRHDPEPQD